MPKNKNTKSVAPELVPSWAQITLNIGLDGAEKEALQKALAAPEPFSIKSILDIFKKRQAIITNLAYRSDGHAEETPVGALYRFTRKTVEVTILSTDNTPIKKKCTKKKLN